MEKTPLNPDARSLEEAFFAKENAKLLEEMRRKAALRERRDALRQVVQGADDALLDHLLELGINAETMLAMGLLPLTRVAWADGAIDPKEREAILEAAMSRGVSEGSPGHQLLLSWLERAPGTMLVEAWKRYIGRLWPALTQPERDELRGRLMGLARGVAEAAGGFLGLGSKISQAERAMLEEIEAALR